MRYLLVHLTKSLHENIYDLRISCRIQKIWWIFNKRQRQISSQNLKKFYSLHQIHAGNIKMVLMDTVRKKNYDTMIQVNRNIETNSVYALQVNGGNFVINYKS